MPSETHSQCSDVGLWYETLGRLCSAIGNHIAPDPTKIAESDSKQESTTQSLEESLAVAHQHRQSEEYNTLYNKYTARYPKAWPVRAHIYNGPITVGTVLPEDRIETKPQEGLYDAKNGRVAFMDRDGTTMRERLTEGTQSFEGTQEGVVRLILIGEVTELKWIKGDEAERTAQRCAGGWGVVVASDVYTSQNWASTVNDKAKVE